MTEEQLQSLQATSPLSRQQQSFARIKHECCSLVMFSVLYYIHRRDDLPNRPPFYHREQRRAPYRCPEHTPNNKLTGGNCCPVRHWQMSYSSRMGPVAHPFYLQHKASTFTLNHQTNPVFLRPSSFPHAFIFGSPATPFRNHALVNHTRLSTSHHVLTLLYQWGYCLANATQTHRDSPRYFGSRGTKKCFSLTCFHTL